MVHGKDSLKTVLGSTNAFFGIDLEKDLHKMTHEQFESHFQNTNKIKVTVLDAQDISSVVVKSGLRKTKAEVRRVI